jgi:TPP-dependent pyruvate/acetoin dehydrogenase alpha subunit
MTVHKQSDAPGEIHTQVHLYTTMRRIREFEEMASRLLAESRIPGFLHLSIGQEAVAAGVCDVLSPTDTITTTHRGHGHCIAKGARVDRMMAELFGRVDGYSGGRSGSMHLADPAVGILGANAIVGAGIPIAVGAAVAAQIRRTSGVSVAFFGEGAVAEGIFHESLNLAGLWRLPVIFVCENNQYAEMSHISQHLATTSVAEYAKPHGIPATTIDGNDALVVRSVAESAVARARERGGPSLIECMTYRLHGHFEGDQQSYRMRDEVQAWRQRDPLLLLREGHLRSGGDNAVLDAIDLTVKAEIARAVSWAEASEKPGPSDLTSNTYQNVAPFGLPAP